ncbi:MAG: tRNA (guanine-N(1)-)-methyltransferase [uncultured bacterium]|nr:MAG: tRNA (guanine-N(1)-)-methyltransferase [uncultured bacterium]
MKIDILTLFPKMFESVFSESIIKRAKEKGVLDINTHNLRDWATDKHKTVDDTTYGGGAGMVLKVDVIDHALHDLKFKIQNSNFQSNSNVLKLKIQNLKFNNQLPYVVMMTPQGKTFNQQIAKKLSKKQKLIVLCGHYEGFDERVRYLVDEQISIGDYVLTGGEIPAMVLVDAVSRLIPGVLGKTQSHQEESFSMNMFVKNSKFEIRNSKLPTNRWLEFPQYTRPEKYHPISKVYKKALLVPKVLLSGNHKKINQWRVEKSICRSHLGNRCNHHQKCS